MGTETTGIGHNRSENIRHQTYPWEHRGRGFEEIFEVFEMLKDVFVPLCITQFNAIEEVQE